MLAVIILAIVEGLTEFLPVSSTGHLVVASSLLDFRPEWAEAFKIVIQFGAILAVVVDRRRDLIAIARSHQLVQFGILLFIAFVPSAALGLIFHHKISDLLMNAQGVCLAWVLGGIAILAIDRPGRRTRQAVALPDDAMPRLTRKQAFLVGCAQCLSLWPGMSRSACTILGGMLVGLDRLHATLFSFYLAIPTMFAASCYELIKEREHLAGAGPGLAVGMVVSFLVAWAVIRWMLRFVQTHTFRPFAVYRIVAGLLLLTLPDITWEKPGGREHERPGAPAVVAPAADGQG